VIENANSHIIIQLDRPNGIIDQFGVPACDADGLRWVAFIERG
jgi:hypothetical protein